tara:strand:- start:24 stop:209 length:186 start_codon:yes stop_codon:yes gene_type:complete
MSSLPADSLTTDFGIKILATAIVRTNSLSLGGFTLSKGVPGIGTSKLIGTLSGCCSRLARD